MPWERYADEFEAKMPPELRAFQEEIAAGSRHKDHSATVRERLEEVAELYKVSRYRPATNGDRNSGDPTSGGRAGENEQRSQTESRRTHVRGGTGGNVYALFEDERGDPATQVDAQTLPEINVDWVSANDGTRTPPHLEDRAAAYDRRRNVLEINADFRGYTDVLRRWERRYEGVAGASIVIEEIAASWWQQGLEETVLGTLALRGSEYWDDRSVTEALSEVSLTAASMSRYHLDAVLKRDLANRLGSLRAAA